MFLIYNIPGWRNCSSSRHCELFSSSVTLSLGSNSASITAQTFFHQASFFITPITISNQSSLQSLLRCYLICCKDPQWSESPRLRWKLYKGDVSNIYRYHFFFSFFVKYILPKFILKRWKPTLDLLTLEYEYMTPLLQVQNITGLCLFKWIKKKMLTCWLFHLQVVQIFNFLHEGLDKLSTQTVHTRSKSADFPTESTSKYYARHL